MIQPVKYILFIFFVLAFFSFCVNENHEQENNKQNEALAIRNIEKQEMTLPENCSWLLKGKVGKERVIMRLLKTGTSLKGVYYCLDTAMIPCWLGGSISGNGKLNFQESPEQEMYFGVFSGAFNHGTLSGYRRQRGEKDSLFFSLDTLSRDLNLKWSYYRVKKCQKINKKNTPFCMQFSDADTMCSGLDLDILQLKMKDTLLERKINKEIELLCCRDSEKRYPGIEKYLQSLKSVPRDELLVRSTDCNLIYFGNNIISVGTRVIENNCGMHPWRYGSYLNLDLRDGRKILLEDLFEKGFESELQKIAVKQAGSEVQNFFMGAETPFLRGDFAITAAGFLFTYDQYEIASYPYGCPNIFIPYIEIRHLLKKDGLLTGIINDNN